MAWHWLDAEKFYNEAKRVLKPGGCLAIYGHGVMVQDNERIKNAFDLFFDALIPTESLGEENMHVLNNYEGVEIPFSQTQQFEFSLITKIVSCWDFFHLRLLTEKLTALSFLRIPSCRRSGPSMKEKKENMM